MDGSRIVSSLAKIVAASALMGVAGHFSNEWLRDVLPGDALLTRLVRVGAAIGASLATLALAAWALRIQEFRTAVARVFSQASSRKPQAPGPSLGPKP